MNLEIYKELYKPFSVMQKKRWRRYNPLMDRERKERNDELGRIFWENVRTVLKERKMTWTELAKRIGIDHRTIASRKATPGTVTLFRAKEIAEALGTSLDRLVYGCPKLII